MGGKRSGMARASGVLAHAARTIATPTVMVAEKGAALVRAAWAGTPLARASPERLPPINHTAKILSS